MYIVILQNLPDITEKLLIGKINRILINKQTIRFYFPCADPEIFMRGGPTKMEIFGHRRGGVQHPKYPEITFFLGIIFKFQGGSGHPVPPSGSAHAFIFIINQCTLISSYELQLKLNRCLLYGVSPLA